jgi:hypothetical protein
LALSAREQRARRRGQLALLVKVMSDPVGREYFWDLLASCHLYSTSFGTNALIMAFREGERNVGIRIAADLTEASPDLYLDMCKEGEYVRSQNRRAAERRSEPDAGFTDDGTDGSDTG